MEHINFGFPVSSSSLLHAVFTVDGVKTRLCLHCDAANDKPLFMTEFICLSSPKDTGRCWRMSSFTEVEQVLRRTYRDKIIGPSE